MPTEPTPVANKALTENELSALRAEFTGLQSQQWDALQRAVFIGMTAEEAQAYEGRARRITELQRALGISLNIPRTW